MGSTEIRQIDHRIYSVGRVRQIGLLPAYELKDQDGIVLKQGRYSECMNALTQLWMAATRRAAR
jgi:hypothetical protein